MMSKRNIWFSYSNKSKYPIINSRLVDEGHFWIGRMTDAFGVKKRLELGNNSFPERARPKLLDSAQDSDGVRRCSVIVGNEPCFIFIVMPPVLVFKFSGLGFNIINTSSGKYWEWCPWKGKTNFILPYLRPISNHTLSSPLPPQSRLPSQSILFPNLSHEKRNLALESCRKWGYFGFLEVMLELHIEMEIRGRRGLSRNEVWPLTQNSSSMWYRDSHHQLQSISNHFKSES